VNQYMRNCGYLWHRKVSLVKYFTILISFCWRFDQFDCFGSNSPQKVTSYCNRLMRPSFSRAWNAWQPRTQNSNSAFLMSSFSESFIFKSLQLKYKVDRCCFYLHPGKAHSVQYGVSCGNQRGSLSGLPVGYPAG